MEILNPRQLWENYDRGTPPDETVIKQSADGRVRHLYFNGFAPPATEGSGRVRVYARLVLPAGAGTDEKTDAAKENPPPVIIYAGGINEDIDQTDVSFFTDGGYAVLLVDYAGDTGAKTRYAMYPAGIDAYWQTSPQEIKKPRALKKCCWYYWTACILHAATYLEKCGTVDKNKIAFFGAFEGAPLVWKSSAIGPIKCGATFFGGDLVASGAADRDYTAGEPAERPATKENDEEMLTYKAALESRAYAQTAYPVLINATTNSRDCSFDYLSGLYDSAPAAAFCVLSGADTAVSEAQRGNILPWFDRVLSGEKISVPKKELSVFGSGGIIYAEVEAEAERVEIFYAEDNPAAFRHFKRIVPTKAGENKYLTKLDVFDATRPVLVFANITAGGFTLTTPVITRQPAKLGAAKNESATGRLLFQDESGQDEGDAEDDERQSTGFLVQGGGFLEKKQLTFASGPFELRGLCGDTLVTFKPGDSRFRAAQSSLLQLTVSAKEAQEIEIYITDRTGGEYFCSKKIAAGQWTTFSLGGAEFKSPKGSADFCRAVGIRIKGRDIILNSLLWV